MPPDDIGQRRKDLVKILNEYYGSFSSFLDDYIKVGGQEASTSFLENLSKKTTAEVAAQIEELKEEMKKNETKASGHWYVDLAIVLGAGLAGPILGQLTEKVMRKGLGVIFNRMAKERLAVYEQNLLIDEINRGSFPKWRNLELRKYTPEQKLHLETIWLDRPVKPKAKASRASWFNSQEFVEFISPVSNDTVNNYAQRLADGIAGISKSKSSPSQQSESYGKDQYKKLEKLEENLRNLPGVYVQRIVNDYVATAKKDGEKYLKNKLHFIEQSDNLDVINKLIIEYTEKKGEVEQNSNLKAKYRFSQVIESIIWIYYLGEPSKWASLRDNTEKKYYIEKQEFDYGEGLDHRKGKVKAFALNIKPGIGAILDSLAIHFLADEENEKNFKDKSTEEKILAANQRSSGQGFQYGRDIRDTYPEPPGTIRKEPETFIGYPQSEDYNLRDYIRWKMIMYFKSFASMMNNGEISLIGEMKIKGVDLPIVKDSKG
jgi:hypothetical protein